tara:strand:+ start:459689 stop:461932 length:2244 start_codon:yes stop_codon:yes gene_type:complete
MNKPAMIADAADLASSFSQSRGRDPRDFSTEPAPRKKAGSACKWGQRWRHWAPGGNSFLSKGGWIGAWVDKMNAADDPSPEDDAIANPVKHLVDTAPSNSFANPMSFAFAPGSKPLPPYTIRRGIGTGGFGVVYFAVSDAGKEVALKHVQRNLDVELRGASQCLNLKHPNLVALYDICRDANEQAWVVMEYVAGRNLREVLDESPDGLPESEVRRWFGSIAAGIGHLHSAGLVHRDIKPGNVFDDLGVVKVGDYGLSKFISASHRGGHTESVGTFHYMAPEIGRGEYGREIDIYALGILLYELLTGRVPFDGESCHEIIVKHLTATPDLSDVAQPYRDVISRSLQKDPAARPASVAEMAAALGIDLARGEVEPVFLASVDQVEPPVVATVIDPSPAITTAVSSAALSDTDTSLDEPFARAVRQSVADLKRWWSTLDNSPGAKGFLAVMAVLVLLVNTHWLLPLLTVIGIVYVPYYIVRQMVLHVSQQPTYAEAQRIATVTGARTAQHGLSRAQWRSLMRTDLRAKHSVQRIAELSSSWIASSFTVMAMMVAAAVIGLRTGTVDAIALSPYAWMATIVLVGSLSLLGLGKLWERDEGEGLPRRLVLAGIGAGVGATAFALSEFLMLPIDENLSRDIDATTLPQALYTASGTPMASALIAHFALLFALLRWWKPVDPLRRSRLSLWSVAVAVVAEWAVHQLLPVPQPMGMLIAGGLAVTVQMSAPWINPRLVQAAETIDDAAVAQRSVA